MTQATKRARSAFALIGNITVRVRDVKTGRILRTVSKRNTITYDAGNVVRALLAQRATDSAASAYSLGSMRFGTSSVAATRADTDLIAEVSAVRKELTDGVKLDGATGELVVQATLASGDGNGNTFQEAGLFTLGTGTYNDPVGTPLLMFARQVHAPLAKTVGIALDYEWALQFTTS